MEEKEAQSKKPEDSDFQQQRLRAWQPLLTPKWVITTFFMIGVVFLPIGIAILVASRDVVEYSYRYDQLNSCDKPARSMGGDGVSSRAEECMTVVDFNITTKMRSPVFVYYKLTNFYQNHRRYVKSRSDIQLRGDQGPYDTTSCDPLTTYPYANSTRDVPIYPCGLIANSVFNDTFDGGYFAPGAHVPIPVAGSSDKWFDGAQKLGSGGWDTRNPETPTNTTDTNNKPTWKKAGISWQSDRDNKFKYINVTGNNGVNIIGPGGFVLPRVDDEDFIVWMRTAGLPTFKKLYRVINQDIEAGSTLRIRISSVFPVSEFSGEKHVVISTTSWLGGKNDFLGIAYIVVGSICLFLAALFLLKHCISPRPLGDMKYFNWPGQTPIRAQAAPRVAQ